MELDTKVRGVREGIQRVFDERIKREKDVVDSRILAVRNQMDNNKEQISLKLRSLKDRMQSLQQ